MPRGTKRSEAERRALLAEQAQSKLTLAQFAQRKGIPLSTLSGWKTALRSRGKPRTPEHRVARSAPKQQAAVLPVRVIEAPAPSPAPLPAPVIVELRTGYRLVLHPGFLAAEVAALIRALDPSC